MKLQKKTRISIGIVLTILLGILYGILKIEKTTKNQCYVDSIGAVFLLLTGIVSYHIALNNDRRKGAK